LESSSCITSQPDIFKSEELFSRDFLVFHFRGTMTML
jgi:hypothetical protein